MKCRQFSSISEPHAAPNVSPPGQETIREQHGDRETEKLPNVGALSFKTRRESFSLEDAVPLLPSHAAEPRCITMTQECPLCQGNLHRATAHWGRGRQREGEGGANKREPD